MKETLELSGSINSLVQKQLSDTPEDKITLLVLAKEIQTAIPKAKEEVKSLTMNQKDELAYRIGLGFISALEA